MSPGRRLVLIGVTVEAAVNAAGAPADFNQPAMAALQLSFWAFAPIALALILHDDWPTDRWLLFGLAAMATAAAAASALKIHDRAIEWGFAGWQAWLPVVYINGLILYGMRREHIAQSKDRESLPVDRRQLPPVVVAGKAPAGSAVGAVRPAPSSTPKLPPAGTTAKPKPGKPGGRQACIQLLEANPELKAAELAERVECSERTAARAIADFKAAA